MTSIKDSLLVFNKETVSEVPTEPGVYIFFNKSLTPIYIGKSVSLRTRLKSYLSERNEPKTRNMVENAHKFTFIRVFSEVEALILEAKLVSKYKPKYNIQLKDDKSPLYIRITKEKYPRVLITRKNALEKLSGYIYGPFLSSRSVVFVLKQLRKMFPYATHLPEKRQCFYSQLGLCNPCPSLIERAKDSEKDNLAVKYKNNLLLIRKFLEGKKKSIILDLEKRMNYFSKKGNYEEAQNILNSLRMFTEVTSKIRNPFVFFEDPLTHENEIKTSLANLQNLLSSHFINSSSVKRIECFDIAHLSGTYPTASMVVFENGEPSKKLYRHFKIRHKGGINDPLSLSETAKRRIKHLSDWGRPDLILVDGGKSQVAAFQKVVAKQNIPVVGIAKLSGSLVIPVSKGGSGFTFKTINLTNSGFLELVNHLKDEAHRFARKLHHKLLRKSYGF